MINRLRRFLVASLPTRLRSLLRDLAQLSAEERRIYLRRRRTSRHGPTIPPDVGATSRIVFICHGNILRSPMAEALCRKELAARGLPVGAISSAGVAAAVSGQAHSLGRTAAPAFGLSLDDHLSQPLTDELVGAAELLVVMDHLNEARLLRRFPYAEKRLVLLGQFDPAAGSEGVQIDDPYGHSPEVVSTCYSRIERSVRAMVDRLPTGATSHPSGR